MITIVLRRFSLQIILIKKKVKTFIKSGEFLPFKRKIDKIKNKEEDEWAKIALVKSLELNEELKKKREKEEERRRKIREDLAQQIIFKKQRVNSEKEDDGMFAKFQTHKNEIFDKIVHDKKENNKKEVIKALEISENLYKSKANLK